VPHHPHATLTKQPSTDKKDHTGKHP
jgi:hypothetical protein